MKEYKISEIKNLHVYGRTTNSDDALTLFWLGSGIEVNVKASEMWIEVEVDFEAYEPWISVSVDGAPVSRQMLIKGRYWLPVVRQMDTETMRTIRILRETQAMSGDPHCMLRIHSVRIEGEFCPLQEKHGKIEFIGDSITSGEGTVGAKQEQNWNSMVFSAVNEYGVLTADELGADYHIISQSGWGILSSWDGNPQCNIPTYYDQVCGLLEGAQNEQLGAKKLYDFDSWQPDVVVINLGTNDAAAFLQPSVYKDEATGELFDQKVNEDGSYDKASLLRLEQAMTDFIKQVRSHNAKAEIIWVYNMLDAALNDFFVAAVEKYKSQTGDAKISSLEVPITTDDNVGSRCHPGRKCHQQAKEALLEKIKGLALPAFAE